MNKPSGPHIEVAITGTLLSRIDADGPDPLTYDEFVDFVSSAADHLHDDDTLIDPVVSGHASTGESTVSFGVLVFIGAPELNGQISRSSTISIRRSAGLAARSRAAGTQARHDNAASHKSASR